MRSQSLKALAVAASMAPLAAHAWPAMPSLNPRHLVPRASAGQGLGMMIAAVKEFLKDRNAYDEDVPDKCILKTITASGTNCITSISCPGGRTTFPTWNVCYLYGRQYFTWPEFGDFSINYTRAGGVDGDTWDGLHHPIIQMAGLNDWEPIDVQKIADESAGQSSGRLCKQVEGSGTKRIEYTCGLPKLGTAGFGMSNYPEVSPDPGFTPGWCTMHVVQHQRNEFGVGNEYAFDVVIFDAVRKEIGKVQLASIDGNSKTLSVGSQLPYTVEIVAAGDDNAPVVFKYADQTWQSGDGSHQSNFGNGPVNGFENGNREGDMGFTC